jgi:quercetin dioxygenase-like cupin family protein
MNSLSHYKNKKMDTLTSTPKIVSSTEGAKFNIMGHEVTVKLHSSDANNTYVFELSSPSGSGIPPHLHEREDEIIYILEGEFEVMVGGEVSKASAGDWLNFRRNIPHGYTNTGTSSAKTLWFVNPGNGFENFFGELSRFPPGPPDMDKLQALTQKYGQRFLI